MLATLAGLALHAAGRFGPGLAGAVCAVTGAAIVHPAARWLTAAGSLLALDRRRR